MFKIIGIILSIIFIDHMLKTGVDINTECIAGAILLGGLMAGGSD